MEEWCLEVKKKKTEENDFLNNKRGFKFPNILIKILVNGGVPIH